MWMQNNLQSTLYKSNKVLTVTFLQSERTCENWKITIILFSSHWLWTTMHIKEVF